MIAALLSGLTLNPMTTALDAAARIMSVSVIAPTPLWITLTLISSVDNFSSEFRRASMEP